MDEFEALTSLVLGEPILRYGTQEDMFRQLKAYEPPPDAMWMEARDWDKLWNDIISSARYSNPDIRYGQPNITWCGIKIMKMKG